MVALSFSGRFKDTAAMLGKFAPTLETYSDASDWGFGASFRFDWLVGTFQEGDYANLRELVGHHFTKPNHSVCREHINTREMCRVWAAALRWAAYWRNAHIQMITDNITVQSAIVTGLSKEPKVMDYIKKLFWLSIENYTLSSVYISTYNNRLCDALGRLKQLGMIEKMWVLNRDKNTML